MLLFREMRILPPTSEFLTASTADHSHHRRRLTPLCNIQITLQGLNVARIVIRLIVIQMICIYSVSWNPALSHREEITGIAHGSSVTIISNKRHHLTVLLLVKIWTIDLAISERWITGQDFGHIFIIRDPALLRNRGDTAP